jgi:hypothetical protein
MRRSYWKGTRSLREGESDTRGARKASSERRAEGRSSCTEAVSDNRANRRLCKYLQYLYCDRRIWCYIVADAEYIQLLFCKAEAFRSLLRGRHSPKGIDRCFSRIWSRQIWPCVPPLAWLHKYSMHNRL